MRKDRSRLDKITLFDNECFTLHNDGVEHKDGSYAKIAEDGTVKSHSRHGSRKWHPGVAEKNEIAYEGSIPVLNAAYNLAIKELRDSLKDRDTLSTGVNWSTVWTRDTSYSIHLGVAFSNPEESIKTLLHRIAVNGEIEQDTGTGGSWPISTDRVVWGIAAWELYLMTGDKEWLEASCRILEETCLHDNEVLPDMAGMIRGETSFLDWRQQSYPDWMTPSDIGESSALSTMILHFRARKILSDMYAEMDKPQRAVYWKEQGDRLGAIIENIFWMPYHGLYGQYVYGRGYPVLSERSDALGESLSVLLGLCVGERAENIVSAIPRCPMGLPCFYPMKTTTLPAYHNEGVWPFVEGYYVQAAARVGNANAVMAGIASMVRAALISGSNKENFNIKTGFAEDTALSSSGQLWSIAGMLGVFYKAIFGMRPGLSGMELQPCLPEELKGQHSLSRVSYRHMTFDIKISGFGTKVAKCTINGKEAAPFLPADMEGHHSIEIELEPDASSQPGKVAWSPLKYDLPMPEWDSEGTELSWHPVEGADYYRVYRNGVPIAQTEETAYNPKFYSQLSHFQIMAVSLDGRESYLNEPKEHIPGDARIETRPCGFTGDSFWVSRLNESDRAAFHDVNIAQPGVYRVDAYFANGMASLRDGNTCALRSLMINGSRVGSLAFPHISEEGDWDVFGYTPGIEVALPQGSYKVEMLYQAYDENANSFVNDTLIKNLRFTRIGS